MMTLMIAMNDKNLSHPPINANTRESVFAFIRVHSRLFCCVFLSDLRVPVLLRGKTPPSHPKRIHQLSSLLDKQAVAHQVAGQKVEDVTAPVGLQGILELCARVHPVHKAVIA